MAKKYPNERITFFNEIHEFFDGTDLVTLDRFWGNILDTRFRY